jgi:hypothetical protein
MLRHIISVSLAMTACATLMPTKANAVSLTLEPVGTLQRKPGDTIQFVVKLNPNTLGGSGNEVEIQDFFLTYDDNELSFLGHIELIADNTKVSTITTIARSLFNVLPGVKKDGINDISATVEYQEGFNSPIPITIGGPFYDVEPVTEPVPEPLTMFGAAAALGYGAILKRKYSKNTES